MASSFYQLRLCPRFSHGGGATGSEGLASNLGREVMAEVLNEPRTNGDRTSGCKPELGMEREERIAGFEVPCHDRVRVRHTCYFLYDDAVPFEGGVGFVCW